MMVFRKIRPGDFQACRRRPAAALAFCLLLASGGFAGAATVTVDADTAVVLGNETRIRATLFGITAFQGGPAMVADLDYRARVLALRPGCIRFPGNVSWCAPPTFDPAWYGTPAAMRLFCRVLLFGARYPIGRFLPVTRSLGAEPMCSLGGVPEYLRFTGTRNPADFDKWAALCAAYVGLWKAVDPKFRLVQIWNEPNASWFRDPRVAGKDKPMRPVELHIDMARKVAAAIKKKFPDILVGGPVLCWGPSWPPNQKGKAPWYTWSQWTVPWLEKTAGLLDFFDFHVYGMTPEDFAVQVGMLANQAERSQGRRLPIWITESNYHLTPEERRQPRAIWQKRVLPYERFLLHGVLPQADKVRGNLYHDLHAAHHTLLPRGAADPDPAYWLLWILRDLRGTRVQAVSDDPVLTTYATLEEDRVTVVVFNDAERETPAALELTIPGGYWTGPYIRLLRENAAGTCEPASMRTKFTRHGARASGRIVLPPHATASITFRTASFARPAHRVRVEEYFGNRTLVFLRPGEPAELEFSLPDPAAGGTVSLRLGLLGAEPDDGLVCRLNGVSLPVRPTALQDIPVPAGRLKKTNRLVLEAASRKPPNPRLALGFASLRHRPDAARPRRK